MIAWLCRRRTFLSTLSSRYDQLSHETLESLSDYLDELSVDTVLSNGVLTVKIPAAGTYVINRQPPNKQLWLSSPRSGPKRYDLSEKEVTYLTANWVCAREGGQSLKEILDKEFSVILDRKIDCP